MAEDSFIIDRESGIKLYCYYFIPEDRKNIKGIVQIIHGFGEHAMRYREFANVLVANGYVVCTADNRGHGKSAIKNQSQKMGHIANDNGANLILEDLHTLMQKVKSDFGSNLDYFLFGHSFGSFLARAFAIRYVSDINALILSATKSGKDFKDGLAHSIVKLQKTLFGSSSVSFFMHKMSTGGYSKKFFPEDCHRAAWLTSDKSEQMKFIEDEYCLKTPASIATYIEIFNVIDEMSKKENINKMRKDLPILIISGEDDVIGDFSRGVDKLYKTYTDIGLTNVTKKIYKGLRHEILNERDKVLVMDDIVEWIKSNTKSIPSLYSSIEKGKNIFKDFADNDKKDDDTISNNTNIIEDESIARDESVVAFYSSDEVQKNDESVITDVAPTSLNENTAEVNGDSPTDTEPQTETSDEVNNIVVRTANIDTTNITSQNIEDTFDENENAAAVKKETTTAAKKSTAKKETTTAAKKSTAKKETTTAAKKVTAKKETTAAAKKATAKKETAAAAKKATAKKETAAAAKKATAKKETAAAAKKATAKKETAAAAKKATAKKETAAAAKKATDKKETTAAAAKKSTAKKTSK